MAEKIIEMGLTPVEEYYGSEVMLHYPGLYAGSTDLVCMHNGLETIVDFKQSNRPKKEEWVEDYYLQISAYAMAHDAYYGSEIRQGVIMICTPDLYYQEFRITDQGLRSWKHKFLRDWTTIMSSSLMRRSELKVDPKIIGALDYCVVSKRWRTFELKIYGTFRFNGINILNKKIKRIKGVRNEMAMARKRPIHFEQAISS